MPVTIEMYALGDAERREPVRAVLEEIFGSRPGEWQVSIIGSQANDQWEMKIQGPNGFERTYTLEGTAGEHRPEVIRVLLERMLAPAVKTPSTSST